MKTEITSDQRLKAKVSHDSPFYDLIQDAYREFKQGPTEHGVCDCCMYQDIRQDFFNHGQRGLPFHYLQDWFFAAAEIPLRKSVWQFVLPRTLEVLASGEEPSTTGIEVSLNRFDTGNPNNWSASQWRVLNEFQKLYLAQDTIANDNCLDDVLCMFASAGWNTNDLFTQVSSWPAEKLVSRLWNDWCRFANPSIWITAFWDEPSVPMGFYASETLLEKVTEFALDDGTDFAMAEKAMAVSDLIGQHASYR